MGVLTLLLPMHFDLSGMKGIQLPAALTLLL